MKAHILIRRRNAGAPRDSDAYAVVIGEHDVEIPDDADERHKGDLVFAIEPDEFKHNDRIEVLVTFP